MLVEALVEASELEVSYPSTKSNSSSSPGWLAASMTEPDVDGGWLGAPVSAVAASAVAVGVLSPSASSSHMAVSLFEVVRDLFEELCSTGFPTSFSQARSCM